MAHGLSAIPLDEMFHLDVSRRTRGHSLKLIKYRCNKDVKKYLFSFRVISKWNMLDDTTVTVKTVNSFKSKLEPGNGEEDEDGSVLGLKSAGPRGRHGDPEGRPASILQVQ